MNNLEDNLNEYINGTISFLTYRERRSLYINHFVNSGHSPDDTIPLNNIEQQQLKSALKQKLKENAALDASSLTLDKGISTQSIKQYVILATLILAAALAWYFSSQVTDNKTTLPTNTNATQNKISDSALKNTKQENAKKIEQKFLVDFLKRDKWDADTLSEFLVKWQALSRVQKNETKKSQVFIRLKNSLRLRILEQQALQSTKNKVAERQESLLIWFASQLSVAIN